MGGGRIDAESETFVTAPLTSNPYGDHESRESLLVTHSLRADGFDASEDGTGRGTPLVTVVAFEPRFARNGRGAPDTIASPLKAESGRTGKGDGATCVARDMAVRRLTPLECTRLQGFPDDYLDIPGMADGPKYKCLGNSMAVPVMAWIASRIIQAHAAGGEGYSKSTG